MDTTDHWSKNRRAATDGRDRAANERFSVHETLLALPTLLDGAGLPDGVIELSIEDSEAPSSQLLDIHDGHVELGEPGHASPGSASPAHSPPGPWRLDHSATYGNYGSPATSSWRAACWWRSHGTTERLAQRGTSCPPPATARASP